MQVDARRDHSFRLPLPNLAAMTGAPDACTSCHRDETPAWAAEKIQAWTGSTAHSAHYGELLQAARRGYDPLQALTKLIGDLSKPAIVRATAADELGRLGPQASPVLRQALQDEDALVRAYAASAFGQMPPSDRIGALLPLLDDPRRAVRDQAVRALADVPIGQFPLAKRPLVLAQSEDYYARLQKEADLPGGRLNLAVFLERQGQRSESKEQYRAALRMDPYFTPARINLVTLASMTGGYQEAETLLRDGLKLPGMPEGDRGHLAYLLGLHLVDRGRPREGLQWISKSAILLPENPRIRYNQGLLLLRMQRPNEANEVLKDGLKLAPADADLLFALIHLHGSRGDIQEATKYLRKLERAHPTDPRLAQLKHQLGG